MLKIKDSELEISEELLKCSYGNFTIKKKYDEDTGDLKQIQLRNIETKTLICYYNIIDYKNHSLVYSGSCDISIYEKLLYLLIKAQIIELEKIEE